MFELHYQLTADDVKSVNKKMALMYFALYAGVAALGIVVGILAVVLRPQPTMIVFGSILLVLGSCLLVCAVLLLIAPKNFVASIIPPSEHNITVKADDTVITAEAGGKTITVPLSEVSKVSDKKSYLLVYAGRESVLIIKDAVTSGQTLPELYEHIKARMGVVLPDFTGGASAAPVKEETQAERADFNEQFDAEEETDTTDADEPEPAPEENE